MADRSDSWRDRYCSVRVLTERLAEPLGPEDQTVQSMADVSPTKWHRAHVTWFFEEFVLGPYARDYVPFHPQFGFLFNSYYEAVGERHPRPERGLLSRPTASEIGEYRRHVDEAVVRLLASDLSPRLLDLIELGLHHEQQHQELLLMDAKHVMSQSPLDPVYASREVSGTRLKEERGRSPVLPAHAAPSSQRAARALGSVGPLTWTAHAGGLVEIGHDGAGFAYDNEGPRHTVWLEPYELADRPVTNGEWLAFVDDGGYERPELWLSEGWATVQTLGWDSPLYWRHDGGAWSQFTLSGRRPVDDAEPVCHVSHFEADAFARWAGARLPTEAEWEVAAAARPVDESRCLDVDVFHPRPLDPPDSGAPSFYGDVWEWTSSPYTPYPGFEPAPGAVGEYNGKFMVNQQVLRGGCCVTPRGHIRATYRNFFPAGSRWVFAGLRLARGGT